jgi:hypothetical protein
MVIFYFLIVYLKKKKKREWKRVSVGDCIYGEEGYQIGKNELDVGSNVVCV